MAEKGKSVELQSGDRHTGKEHLEAPSGKLEFLNVLEALDRDVAFYRRRAGQVYFFGLVFEILILAGREKDSLVIPAEPAWITPLVYSVFFIAVVVAGVTLGREYRSRIRYLKDSRLELLAKSGFQHTYPTDRKQRISEIQVLYFVLLFLSSIGTILVWSQDLLVREELTRFHITLAFLFAIAGAVGVVTTLIAIVKAWWSSDEST